MTDSLKTDICGFKFPGVSIHDVEKSVVDNSLPPEVQYACRYWVDHVQGSAIGLHDNDEVHQFLQQHFLHWLEALGWMNMMAEGIEALGKLGDALSVCDSPDSSIYEADVE